MNVLFESKNLIGDALYISPALRAWIKRFERLRDIGEQTIIDMWMLTLNDHVAPLYEGMLRGLEHDELNTFGLCYERPNVKFDFEHKFDVSAAFALSTQKKQHLAQSYADLLEVEIPRTKEALKPTYIPQIGLGETIPEDLQGCILISMFSASCTSRDKNKPGMPPNKMLPFDKWVPLIDMLRREFPSTPIRFLGAPSDIVPNGYALDLVRPGEYMLGIPLNRLALIMRSAKLVVTIDNGMSHLAASQETPTFLMYPICLSTYYILPIGNPNMVYVQMNPVTVHPIHLIKGLEYAIARVKEKK